MKFIIPNWPAPATVKAYTTSRQGWGAKKSSHETEKGFHTSDENESKQLKTLLQIPSEPIWLTQKHTNIAIEATPENKEEIADASFTQKPNHICAVLTADCLPVLICNKQGTHVAAIHAGWRGLASGVIEATLSALNQPTTDLLVWLGPAIGPEKFEVGKDVYDAFVAKHPDSAQAFQSISTEKWLANLYDLAKIRLKFQGISAIYGGDYCTYLQDDLFFSYRRDQGKTGRMASLIWLTK